VRAAPGRSDDELASALAARDESALAEMFDRYGALAYGVALRMLGDPGRAEDAVQDAFVKLWDAAGRFDRTRGSLRAWLVTAVRNRSIDLLRGRPGRERQELALRDDFGTPTAGPEERAAASFERDAIRAALAELPAEQRQTVLLAYFGGYSQPEIAGVTGVPLSTVKGRMRLALDKLAAYLKERGVVDV
jgi:RNA polymerase sigma-70 factor (ECF subfamily)